MDSWHRMYNFPQMVQCLWILIKVKIKKNPSYAFVMGGRVIIKNPYFQRKKSKNDSSFARLEHLDLLANRHSTKHHNFCRDQRLSYDRAGWSSCRRTRKPGHENP